MKTKTFIAHFRWRDYNNPQYSHGELNDNQVEIRTTSLKDANLTAKNMIGGDKTTWLMYCKCKV